jgi:hypothetical protein
MPAWAKFQGHLHARVPCTSPQIWIADSGRRECCDGSLGECAQLESDRSAGVTGAGCCWPSNWAGLVLALACDPLQSGLTEDFAETQHPALWVPEKEHHDDGTG